MRISVIGCGYLGAVHAACMAHLGHEVVGLDTDPRRIELLAAGVAPLHEPGLPEMLTDPAVASRLTFTTDPAALTGAQVHFVCVGTPQLPGAEGADLSYLEAAFQTVLDHLSLEPGSAQVIVGKSTVPVGTAETLAVRLDSARAPGTHHTLVWNPEFLREGFAIADSLGPDRIVYGLADDADARAGARVLDEVYASQLAAGIPRLVTDLATAQLVKVAANAFLAMKISFVNAMADMCEASGGNIAQLADAIGRDERIGGKFLRAGLGYGGGCLPKDVRALAARAREMGLRGMPALLADVDRINVGRREHVVSLARKALGGRVAGARVTVWGAAFKPDSDDLRDSPSLAVARTLAAEGADVVVHDPVARAPEEGWTTATDPLEAARGADVVILGTEWRDYREIDPAAVAAVAAGRAVVDGRNALDPARWRDAGWDYVGVGLP